jgi:hypothetical protein
MSLCVERAGLGFCHDVDRVVLDRWSTIGAWVGAPAEDRREASPTATMGTYVIELMPNYETKISHEISSLCVSRQWA